MRHVLVNSDGSVEIYGSRPRTLIRKTDGAVFTVRGSRKRNGRRVLYGSFADGSGGEVDIGDQNVDPADLEADSLQGYTCEFRRAEQIVSAKHPAHAARVSTIRKLTRQELIDSKIGIVDEKGRIKHDHAFRDAWEVADGKLGHNMEKARLIADNRAYIAYNRKLLELANAEILAKEIDEPATRSQAMNEIAARKAALKAAYKRDFSKATTVDQLKAAWPQELS